MADNTDPAWKRNGRSGPLDWWLVCQKHGQLWRSNCFHCGTATNHNDEFAQKLEAEAACGVKEAGHQTQSQHPPMSDSPP